MNILASSSEEKTRRHVRFILEQCADKGYALGSGNSIADYVKIENYLAMIDEGKKFRERGVKKYSTGHFFKHFSVI